MENTNKRASRIALVENASTEKNKYRVARLEIASHFIMEPLKHQLEQLHVCLHRMNNLICSVNAVRHIKQFQLSLSTFYGIRFKTVVWTAYSTCLRF